MPEITNFVLEIQCRSILFLDSSVFIVPNFNSLKNYTVVILSFSDTLHSGILFLFYTSTCCPCPLFIHLFIFYFIFWKYRKGRRGKTDKERSFVFNLLVQSSNAHRSQSYTKPKPGAQKLIHVSLMSGKAPTTLAVLCCPSEYE